MGCMRARTGRGAEAILAKPSYRLTPTLPRLYVSPFVYRGLPCFPESDGMPTHERMNPLPRSPSLCVRVCVRVRAFCNFVSFIGCVNACARLLRLVSLRSPLLLVLLLQDEKRVHTR